VFAKAMVVGASCPRRVRDGGGHPRTITCTRKTSMISRMPLLRTRSSECLCTQPAVLQRAPPGFDQGIGEADLDLGEYAAQLSKSKLRRQISRMF
jgi:hypothetical protein